ncbi:cell cycle control protein 50A-like [Cyprinus carpio]|uniref:Cell cycle control protein 50A n=1 Tax=Cyprinus carpio TaxID=7962 RepID=A0A9Q9Z1X0_CYPCA|nr:cell cycle control protein 50A-like [Cyprinus carpio]
MRTVIFRDRWAPAGPGAVKSKKPDNTAFKQQRLPAWQPILTAGTVLPAFFMIGLIFIPIGIGLLVTSNNIKEFEIDYTGVDMFRPVFQLLAELQLEQHERVHLLCALHPRPAF